MSEKSEKRAPVVCPDAPAAVGPYSQAMWQGNLLFLSGQVGIDPKAGKITGATVADQADQVMRNIGAILKSQDLSFRNVVKTTIYLTDISHFAQVNAVYEKHLEKPYPARTTIAVAALPLGALVEIETIAAR